MPKIKIEDQDQNEELLEHPVSPETNEASQETEITDTQKSAVRPFFVIGVIACLFLIAGLVWIVQDRNKLQHEVNKLSQSQESNTTDDAKLLSAEVGQHIQLPTDEVPTIATVVDTNKVKNQEFFKNAKNGDKVLLYSKISKAILYRPSTKKIIEMAPINIGDTKGGTETNQ